jgi:hypothetical protein
MVTREELIHCLSIDWDAYLERFEELPEGEKKEFLALQGYPTFSALLGHMLAWWRLGMEVIRHYQANPDYTHPAIDVDEFNQAAIARVRGVDDTKIRAEFESVRKEMIRFVNTLSDTALANPKINRQLQIEVIEHLSEHQ